jgi:hypothetical protein
MYPQRSTTKTEQKLDIAITRPASGIAKEILK